MAKTIRTNDLTAGATFLVRGKVAFSRVARQTTDEERQKSNEDRKRKNPRAIDVNRNYTSITIHSATVLSKTPDNPSLEERYAQESCYMSSQTDKYPGLNFTAMNKSSNLPSIGVVDPNKPDTYKAILLNGKELASGLDVTCVCRVFEGKNNNKGVSLDTVLVNEPIRYYEGNRTIDKNLQEFGIVFESVKPNNEIVEGNAVGADEAASVPQTRGPVAQTDLSPAAANPNPAFAPANAGANPFSSYGTPQAAAPVADNASAAGMAPISGVGANRQY